MSRDTRKYFSLPYNPKLQSRARELRKAGVLSEVLLWGQIKKKQFKGLDFDRQKIIGNYIVDFYTISKKLLPNILQNIGARHRKKYEEYLDILRIFSLRRSRDFGEEWVKVF